jgi:hypothetical protein
MSIKRWFLNALKDALRMFFMAAVVFGVAMLAMAYKGELLHFLQ